MRCATNRGSLRLANCFGPGLNILVALCWTAPLRCAGFLSYGRNDANASLTDVSGQAGKPFLVKLRRELYPVKRNGKVVSFKASYSGVVNVGQPWPQEFRMVFDTGSGHVILPSVDCHTDSCRKHRRYDTRVSETAEAISTDGSLLKAGQATDQVTIGFGTGKITGEFARDRVCLGPAGSSTQPGLCVTAQVVTAIEMSNRPFELFDFDGILGLGLHSLALTKEFSFFNVLSESGQLPHKHFGVYLTEGGDGEESEIAIGGHNPEHLQERISWVPMNKPELGYWQVAIRSIRVDGKILDVCLDGTCAGIIDTGTSHLGVPASANEEMTDLLTTDARDVEDCRHAHAPVITIELQDFNMTLQPENYMRKLPLAEDINISMSIGVSPTSYMSEETNAHEEDDSWKANLATAANASNVSHENASQAADMAVKYLCTPKLLPVTWPAPLGPNLFILGEPVLHRYYTVFDWGGLRAGFGLAAHRKSPPRETKAKVPTVEDDVILVQVSISVSVAVSSSPDIGTECAGIGAPARQQLLA